MLMMKDVVFDEINLFGVHYFHYLLFVLFLYIGFYFYANVFHQQLKEVLNIFHHMLYLIMHHFLTFSVHRFDKRIIRFSSEEDISSIDCFIVERMN
jgi:hypothetical protein